MRPRILLLLLLPGLAMAGDWDVLSPLSNDVYDRLGICMGRQQEVARHITIRAKRLTRYLSSGDAFYDSTANQVLVDPDLFSGGKLKDLKAIADLKGNSFSAGDVAGTIFHEMGHAEWDVLIEEGEGDAQDRALYRVATREVRPWIDQNQGDVDSADLGMQEWQAYYRASMITTLWSDRTTLLTAHGLDPWTLEPIDYMVEGALKKGVLTPEDFGRLSPKLLSEQGRARLETPYSQRFRGYPFYVSNGLIDGLVTVRSSEWTEARGFRDRWWQALWNQAKWHFCLPDNQKIQIESLERRHRPQLERLKQLQEQIWARLHPESPSGTILGTGR